MTDKFFDRIIRVTTSRENVPTDPTSFNVLRTVTATDITDLRIQFKIHKSLTKNPNQCDITITNLSAQSRAEMETKPLYVQFDAGYKSDSLRLLFTGDVRFAMSEQKHPNYETLLQLGDGDCMHRWARVNKTYEPGTPVRTILRDCFRSMGFEMPRSLDQDKSLDRSFAAGKTSHGPSRDELTKLLDPFGYTYSTQNGTIRVVSADSVNPGVALPIGEGYGMIGTPQFGSPPRSGKPPHMTVNMLLYPELEPGGLVQLTSLTKNGLFRLETVRHEGDTHGVGANSWSTSVELKPA